MSLADTPEKAKSDIVSTNNDTSSSNKHDATNSTVAAAITKPQSLSLPSTVGRNSPEVDYMSLSVSSYFRTLHLTMSQSAGDKFVVLSFTVVYVNGIYTVHLQ